MLSSSSRYILDISCTSGYLDIFCISVYLDIFCISGYLDIFVFLVHLYFFFSVYLDPDIGLDDPDLCLVESR